LFVFLNKSKRFSVHKLNVRYASFYKIFSLFCPKLQKPTASFGRKLDLHKTLRMNFSLFEFLEKFSLFCPKPQKPTASFGGKCEFIQKFTSSTFVQGIFRRNFRYSARSYRNLRQALAENRIYIKLCE